jgi:hypothetical protein
MMPTFWLVMEQKWIMSVKKAGVLGGSGFFWIFCLQPKWLSSLGRFSQIWILTKNEVQIFIVLVYFWLHPSNQIYEFGYFSSFFLTCGN